MSSMTSFSPSNPWPEPIPDTEQPTRVWRTWTIDLARKVGATLGTTDGLADDPDVRVEFVSDSQVLVSIRSDDPVRCDVHEVMHKTRGILSTIDEKWTIAALQGVPVSRWLFLK